MTRLHARKMALLVTEAPGSRWTLWSPAPGMFRPTVRTGSNLHPAGVLGTLEVLGTTYELVVPEGASGCVAGGIENATTPMARDMFAPRVVAYRDPLAFLVPGGLAGSHHDMPAARDTSRTQGLVFRAPTSGRFYSRSTPDKPPFVSPGDELATGATVCLLEVMKTFHRVHYPGERVKVLAVLVKDGDDVNAGDPLLSLTVE